MLRVRPLHDDQKGIVAFVVTILVMLVVTITTLGVAQIARREQRQALDKVLSTQAYYAAESGINDALKFSPNTTQTTCAQAVNLNTSPGYGQPNLGNKLGISASGSASGILGGYTSSTNYTCALVTLDPTSLEYSQVTPDRSVNALFTTTNPIARLAIGWESDNSTNSFINCASGTNFPSGNSWNTATPLLKIDVTYLSGDLSRNTLINNTGTFYAYPCNGGNGAAKIVDFGPDAHKNGDIQNVLCDQRSNHPYGTQTPLRCSVNVRFGVTSGFPNKPSQVLVRIKPYYANARVSILSLGNSGQTLKMNGAQKVYDATGQAQDELKRVQVRVSSTSPYQYAVESTGAICKRLITNNNSTGYDNTGIPGLDTTSCDPTTP